VKCHHCGECYWLVEAEEIGTVDRWRSEGQQADSTWATAQEVQEPSEEEYYDALEKSLAKDRLQERTLRILAWWRRNDAFRYEKSRGTSADLQGDVPVKPSVELPRKPRVFDQAEAASAEAGKSKLTALATLLDEAEEKDVESRCGAVV
jgi:hypothetical protein